MSKLSKRLIRTWIAGTGCTHLREPELTEVEARCLLKAARPAESTDSDPGAELIGMKLDPHELPGTAYVIANQAPDPDHPQRTVIRHSIVYLPDPDAYLKDAVRRQVDGLEWPSRREDLDSARWISFDPSDPGKGGANQPRQRGPRPRRGKLVGWVLASSIGGALCLCGIFWTGPPSGRNQAISIPDTAVASKPIKAEEDWQRPKNALLKILKKPWAQQITGKADIPNTDQQIVKAFASLFGRPPLSENVEGKGDLSERLENEGKAEINPFTAFIYRLGGKLDLSQTPDSDSAVEWQKRGLEYIAELAEALKKRGVSIMRRGEVDAEAVENYLDYHAFYNYTWKLHHPEWDRKNGEFCDKLDSVILWVQPVRDLLRKRYCKPAAKS